MKPYFARYIPVEGEIKEGDKVKGITSISDCKDDVHAEFLTKKGYTKVKLSLCSRDIKVGDEVYAEPQALTSGLKFKVVDFKGYYQEDIKATTYSIIIEFLQNPKRPDLIGKTHEWMVESCWKVIGEISPDATWVKEGDEFDDDKFRFVIKYDAGFDHYPVIPTPYEAWLAEHLDGYALAKFIQIKGPCGHFH